MKKVTQHFLNVLVAVLSLSKNGSFITMDFDVEGVKVEANADNSIMPPTVLKSILSSYTAKVVEYCQASNTDISKISLSIRKEDGKLLTDSTFTGKVEYDAVPEEELVQDLQDSGIAFTMDLMHDPVLEEA